MVARKSLRIGALLAFALTVAACDKCGNRLHFNTPSLGQTCGANADPAK